MTNLIGNRKLRIIVLIALLIIIVAIMITLNDRSKSNEISVTKENQTVAQGSSAIEFTSLDDYIGYADHIVFGKVTSSSDLDEWTNEYVVRIQRQMKGDVQSKEILVHIEKNTLEMGGEYLLFLERFEGGLYPGPVYNVLSMDVMFKIEEGRLKHQSRFMAKDMKWDGLLEKINTSKSITKNRMKKESESSMVIKDSVSAQELVESSDVIAHIQPESIFIENKYMKFARVKVLETYKGEGISEDDTVILPSIVEAGKSYLVYLQIRNGSYIVSAKSGCVIPQSDVEAWKKALASLEKAINK